VNGAAGRARHDGRGMTGASAERVVCGACRRPATVCYCPLVTRLATRTKVVILQHPRERDMPVNTARIASLCLPDAELHVGMRLRDLSALADPERPAALLYPGPGAIDVELAPPATPVTLVVVDGTWSQARKLVRSNPELAALPRYAFRPPAPSDYRIRREPHEDYVSTLEALVHVLGVLEGDRDRFRAMLAPFRAMVDAQVAFAACGNPRRRTPSARARVPADPRARLPALLRERPHDLVCVHAEANAWPYDTPQRAACPEELVHWVACRPSTGETFEAIVAPRHPLSPTTSWHTGLEASALLGGLSTAALFERWLRFSRPDDIVCTWGPYAPALFAGAGGALPPGGVDIRRAARTFSNMPTGTMETFCTQELGPAVAANLRPTAAGRAGVRLAALVGIVSFFTGASMERKVPPCVELAERATWR
jgi:DTW domain-containing protein